MGQKVVIHPVPGENIPYSLELELDGGRVSNARCGATALWGPEMILAGKQPYDALHIVQRSQAYQGVSHAIAAATGLEGLQQVVPPANGRLLRNILQGLEFIHAHLIHFYQVSLPGFLSVNGAPVPGEKLPPTAGQALREHFWQAFAVASEIHKMMAAFGGKMPFPMSIVPGGVAVQPDYQKVFNLYSRLKSVVSFIRDIYIPDIEMLFGVYGEYAVIAPGIRRLYAVGAFPLLDGKNERQQMFLPAGVVPGSTGPEVKNVTEDMAYAWFAGADSEPGAYPKAEMKSQAYSWLTALKYSGQRCETGPLARMTLAGEGKLSGLGPAAYSVKGRYLARGYESLRLAEKMEEWISGLNPKKPAVTGKFKPPEEGEGWAVTEGPGGSIIHRFRLQDGKIDFYRVFGAANWNLSPRDGGENRGPLEEALIGTPVANPQNPVEAIRVFRAFT